MLDLIKKIFKFHQCSRCTESFWFNHYETQACTFKRCPKNQEASLIFFHPDALNLGQRDLSTCQSSTEPLEAGSAVSELLADHHKDIEDER